MIAEDRVARRGVSRDARGVADITHTSELLPSSSVFVVQWSRDATAAAACCATRSTSLGAIRKSESHFRRRVATAQRVTPTRSPYPLRRGVRRGGVSARADLRERPAIAVCRLCRDASRSASARGAGTEAQCRGRSGSARAVSARRAHARLRSTRSTATPAPPSKLNLVSVADGAQAVFGYVNDPQPGVVRELYPWTAMCVRNVDVHVSCSSHVDAQLAAFFIDPRAK